eukprot:6159960-Prymnesium_polylepis.1
MSPAVKACLISAAVASSPEAPYMTAFSASATSPIAREARAGITQAGTVLPATATVMAPTMSPFDSAVPIPKLACKSVMTSAVLFEPSICSMPASDKSLPAMRDASSCTADA